jgi:hypothetical protein
VRAPQLSRLCLRNHPQLEHYHVAEPNVDFGNDLVRHLSLDAADFGGLLILLGFDRDGERLA